MGGWRVVYWRAAFYRNDVRKESPPMTTKGEEKDLHDDLMKWFKVNVPEDVSVVTVEIENGPKRGKHYVVRTNLVGNPDKWEVVGQHYPEPQKYPV